MNKSLVRGLRYERVSADALSDERLSVLGLDEFDPGTELPSPSGLDLWIALRIELAHRLNQAIQPNIVQLGRDIPSAPAVYGGYARQVCFGLRLPGQHQHVQRCLQHDRLLLDVGVPEFLCRLWRRLEQRLVKTVKKIRPADATFQAVVEQLGIPFVHRLAV